jgi:hypothetical protein
MEVKAQIENMSKAGSKKGDLKRALEEALELWL